MAGGRTVRTNRAREVFLKAFEATCNVTAAANAAGISRRSAYDWRDADPSFAADWLDAEESATDALENVARCRAMSGESDKMLEILLKAHRPEKYVDRLRTELSGSYTCISVPAPTTARDL